jgi:hypothetical protein
MVILLPKVEERRIRRMAIMNGAVAETISEKSGDIECEQSAPQNVNDTDQAKDISNRNALLKKLEETLSNPLHRRLLNAYASTDINFAKESMEHQLASILLEVLDRAD